MSDDDLGGFVAPPFRAEEALVRLQRELRAMGLAERAGRFERRGVAIARVQHTGDALELSVVKRPSRNSPQWTARSLRSHADVRDACADLTKKLAAWSDTDD
jgi:hypothetical protein